jgi:hypothetical protein
VNAGIWRTLRRVPQKSASTLFAAFFPFDVNGNIKFNFNRSIWLLLFITFPFPSAVTKVKKINLGEAKAEKFLL